MKLLNNEYVTLFEARGNEPSKFRYLQVRMDKDKTNALYSISSYADTFDDYENTIYDVARSINNNYIRRFIKKKYVTVPTEEYVVRKHVIPGILKIVVRINFTSKDLRFLINKVQQILIK